MSYFIRGVHPISRISYVVFLVISNQGKEDQNERYTLFFTNVAASG